MIYAAKLKTRKEMERDIPHQELGWWHDVCPGQTLQLRDATAADLARCSLREGTSRNPADYLCETFAHGSLVSRKAVKTLAPVHEGVHEQAVRHAIQLHGADRFMRAICGNARGLQPPPKPSDDQVRAWADRHDISSGNLTHLREAFEDAATLHLVDEAPETPRG